MLDKQPHVVFINTIFAVLILSKLSNSFIAPEVEIT